MICLKKMPSIVDKSSVKMVCVDDFALRKRFSYGTVMINLENHRIVDMIPSRDTNDVCNWLKTFHNIEVISRDGAITYASAATNSHPDVIQMNRMKQKSRILNMCKGNPYASWFIKNSRILAQSLSNSIRKY